MVTARRIMRTREEAQKAMSAGGEFLFDTGDYRATLENVEARPIPEQASEWANPGWATTDGDVLSLQFGQFNPLEGQTDPGARKFFVDLTVRDGNLEIFDVDPDERDQPHWKMQNSVDMMVLLADAMGQEPDDSFLDALRSNALSNTAQAEVTVTIKHRKGSNKKTYAFISDIA